MVFLKIHFNRHTDRKTEEEIKNGMTNLYMPFPPVARVIKICIFVTKKSSFIMRQKKKKNTLRDLLSKIYIESETRMVALVHVNLLFWKVCIYTCMKFTISLFVIFKVIFPNANFVILCNDILYWNYSKWFLAGFHENLCSKA